MKRLLILPLLALTLVCGCTTTPTGLSVPDPAVIELVAQEASAIGANVWLAAHPNDREQFELALASVNALLATGKGSPSDLQAALSRLPIKELSSGKNQVIVTSAVVLINKAGQEIIKLDSAHVWSYYVQPVAQGIASGLQMALDATPKQ